MDSYHITSDNIKTFKEAVTSQINDWKDGFLGVQESINSFINSDSYQGDIAFVLKEYLNNKYIAEGSSTTSVLVELFDLFLTALDEYEQLYQEYEGGEDFAFDYEVIDDSKVRLGDKIVEFLDSMDRIKGTLDSINGINTPSGTVDYARPDTIMVETALEDGNSYIEQLHNDISDIETAGVDKADELEDDITHVTCVMMDYRDCCQNSDNPGFLQPKTLSDTEMGELLGLQSRDRSLLNEQELERLEELERKVQFGSDAAKQSYRYRYNTLPQNQRTNEMMAFNASLEISFSESTLSPSSKRVMELMEQREAYNNALLYEKDPSMRKTLEMQKASLEESIEMEMERALSQSIHAEGFLYADDYLVSIGYELDDRVKIFYYWDKLRDVEDITGIEMPKWWMDEHIPLPEGINIDESNIRQIYEGTEFRQELIEHYFQGYFVVDCISGRPWQEYEGNIISRVDAECYDAATIKALYEEYLLEKANNSETYMDFAITRAWIDAKYGAMYDYATGDDSVRAVKYGLGEKMDFPYMQDNYGVYNVYTNIDNTVYEFAIEAYMAKYEHADHFYDVCMGKWDDDTDDVKANREKQLLEYIQLDVNAGKYIEVTSEEQAMLAYEKNSTTFEDYGCVDFMTAKNLAFQLEHNMYGIGNRSVVVEGNVVKITFDGGEDASSDFVVGERTFEFVINENQGFFGTYYVTYDQVLEWSINTTKEQIDSGYLTPQMEMDLNIQANNLLEIYYTPEEIAAFTQEEYEEKLYCAKISMISTSLTTDCFMNDHTRAVDVFNMARESFVGACQLITLAIVLSNPGTALAGGAVLVNGGIGAADGMVWISQGEIETGVIEVGFSLLDVYGGFKILNETTDIGKIIEPLKNNKGCINFFPEGSVVDDAAEAVSKTVSEGGLNSEYNLFGERAHEHLTTVEGFNKKKGGIIGGHTQEAFDSFSERPINILSKEKLGDGIYEYTYQVGVLERGQYKMNPDGSYVWIEKEYTKTVINTEELSINSFENMAKNAFANKVIYETESGQLYIKGVLENGVKVEGFIDKATMELKSYYPCSKYNNTIKIKGVFNNE